MTTETTPGTDIAVPPAASELAIAPGQTHFTPVQEAAIRALGAEDAPEGDVALLFHQAVRMGLDPFAKQIYLIGRDERKQVNGQWQTVGKKWTIQTAIDGYRVVRERTNRYDGQEVAWCGPDGVWRDVWPKTTPPFAARVLVYVKGRSRPEPAIAYFSEYAQTDKNGNPQAMWKKMPAGQLAKCAEALALRKAFPQDLSGVYIDEEMQQADVGSDGVPAVTRVAPARNLESNRNPGHNGPRGRASETRVVTGPDSDATPVAASRPDRPRPTSAAGAVPDARDQAAVYADWHDRITATDTIDALVRLHTEAADRHVLDHQRNGRSIEDAFLERREQLLNPEPGEPEPFLDETPF